MQASQVFSKRDTKNMKLNQTCDTTTATVAPETHSNSQQMLVTSNKKLIELYKAFYHSQGVDKFGNPTSRPKRRTESHQ